MADDISVVVKVLGQQDIVKTTKSLKSMENGVKTLSKDLDTGRISNEQYITGLKEIRRSVDSSFPSWQKAKSAVDSYAKSVRDSAAALEQAKIEKEVAKVSASYDRLKASIDPVFAAQQRMKKAHADIRAALKAELISRDEAAASLRQYRAALVSSNKVLNQTRNRMNGNNMAIQQLGYQFGDFAVQVQGGTSAFVAFSQQGAQLAGMLPLIAGPLGLTVGAAVALSAALGILIPIGSAVGRMFFEMGDSAKKDAVNADTLDQKLKALRGTLDDYADSLAALKAGVSLDQLIAGRGIDKAKQELAEATEAVEKFKSLGKVTNFLPTALGDIARLAVEVKKFANSKEEEDAIQRLIDARKTLSDLELMQANKRRENYKESAAELDKELDLLRVIEQQGQGSPQAEKAKLDQELQIRLAGVDARVKANELDSWAAKILKDKIKDGDTLNRQITVNTELEENRLASVKTYFEFQTKIAEQQAKREAGVAAIKKSVEDETKSLQNQIQLNQAILDHGKNSVEVRALEAKQAREQYRLRLQEAGILGKNLNKTMELYDASAKLTSKLSSSEDSAKGLAGALREASSAMASLSGFSDSLDKKLAISVAKVQALKSGVDAAVAGSIAGLRVDLDRKISDAKASGVDAGIIERMYGGLRGKISEYGASEAERKRIEEANRKSPEGGGGSADVVNIEDVIAAREKQIQQERVLIGLSGKQRAAQEIYYDLLKQNEDADKKLTEAELLGAAKAIAAQEEQNRVLEEAKQQQNDLAQGIADSMGDAFMSVVDGTKSVKDAFKDMARAIIKQLFEVLVVQRLVGTVGSGNVAGTGLAGLLSGTLFSANGNVFSGGSHVKAYANGGVVGGPTFFPMTGGKTGLMGEAGPEAIMPLKRGPNGKLGVQAEGGSQGNVVVNQSFNFQANGDDSVKRIIAEAAPRIADLTQRQIMDSRRRGGSMKATFG